jgi:hypothetical protein
MKRRGELIKVSSLFDKYKNTLQPPQQTVVYEVVGVINDLCGIKLSTQHVTYMVATNTVSVVAPSVVKQEIARREPEILTHLRGRLGKKAPKKIL